MEQKEISEPAFDKLKREIVKCSLDGELSQEFCIQPRI